MPVFDEVRLEVNSNLAVCWNIIVFVVAIPWIAVFNLCIRRGGAGVLYHKTGAQG
jgi:hypothetical protein